MRIISLSIVLLFCFAACSNQQDQSISVAKASLEKTAESNDQIIQIIKLKSDLPEEELLASN